MSKPTLNQNTPQFPKDYSSKVHTLCCTTIRDADVVQYVKYVKLDYKWTLHLCLKF